MSVCPVWKVWNKFESSANNLKLKKSEELSRSFIYIRKRVGPRTDPCGRDTTWYFHMWGHCLSIFYKLKSVTEVICKPFECNATYAIVRQFLFLIKISWLIVSKAFWKSMNTPSVIFPSSTDFSIALHKFTTDNFVLYFFRKPYWCCCKTLFTSKNSINRLLTIFSNIFPSTGNTEIGL